VHGLLKQTKDIRVEGEVFDRDQRGSGAGGDNFICREDAQPVTRDFQSFENRDVERIQVNPAIETRTQCLDNSAPQNGVRPMEHDLQSCSKADYYKKGGDKDPTPNSPFLASRRR
jgi:hypothetical protein